MNSNQCHPSKSSINDLSKFKAGTLAVIELGLRFLDGMRQHTIVY
jgi:hypothetical protein